MQIKNKYWQNQKFSRKVRDKIVAAIYNISWKVKLLTRLNLDAIERWDPVITESDLQFTKINLRSVHVQKKLGKIILKFLTAVSRSFETLERFA